MDDWPDVLDLKIFYAHLEVLRDCGKGARSCSNVWILRHGVQKRIQISTLHFEDILAEPRYLVFIRTDAIVTKSHLNQENGGTQVRRLLDAGGGMSGRVPRVRRRLFGGPSACGPRLWMGTLLRMHPLHIPFCAFPCMRAVAGTPVQANLCNMVMRFAICGKGVSCSNKI